MNNSGIGFIVWDEGFACSDDVIFDLEKDPIKDVNGKIIFVETKTLKLNFIFEVASTVVKGLKVLCLFKSGENKFAFTGEIRGKSGALTIVDLHTKSERISEIISKIKSLGGN